jgi:hypothetical protein
MPEVTVLTTFGNLRGYLAGMLGSEPLLKWNDNAATNPARWRAATVPVDGGDPLLLPGQPDMGNVNPVGAFDGKVACQYARPFTRSSGFVLSADGLDFLDSAGGRGIYLGFATEEGVFGTDTGVGAVHWGWDGQVVEVRPSGFPHPASLVDVPTPAGFTGFSKRAVSPDGRYVAGVGVNLDAPTRAEMEVHLLVDLEGGDVARLADALECAAISNGLQFAADGSIVCIAQATPATQSVVRVTGWEG